MKRLKMVLAMFTLVCLTTAAYSAKAESGWYFDQNVGICYNPIGAEANSTLYYRLPLYNMPGVLWESCKIDLGVKNKFTPSDEWIGFYCNIEPIAIFDVTFLAGFNPSFNFLGFGFQQVSSQTADYSPATRKTSSVTGVP